MPLWQTLLESSLRSGSTPRALAPYLDEVLAWYAKLDFDEPQDPLGQQLLTQFGERELRVRFEHLLDRLLLSNTAVFDGLFPLNWTPEQGKARYRQLIRLFHPDRGANDVVWLNRRAERINRGYQDFLSGRDRGIEGLAADGAGISRAEESDLIELSRKTVDHSIVAAKSRLAIRFDPEFWRQFLGDPERLLKRAAYIAGGITSMVITLALLSALLEEPIKEPIRPLAVDKHNARSNVSERAKQDSTADLKKSIEPNNTPLPTSSDQQITKSVNKEVDMLSKQAIPEKDKVAALAVNKVASSKAMPAKAVSELEISLGIEGEPRPLKKTKEQAPGDNKKQVETALAAVESKLDKRVDSKTKKNQEAQEKAQTDQEVSSESAVANSDTNFTSPQSALEQSRLGNNIRRLLKRYEAHYKAGDAQAFSGLYLSSARDNQLRGVGQINSYYQSMFKTTSQRDVRVNVSKIKGDDYLSARIIGNIEIAYAADAQKYEDQRGFDMLIIKTQSGFRIASFDWLTAKAPRDGESSIL